MAIPLPGSPASSWAVFHGRVKRLFNGADPRVCAAFWLFGLINNVLYVVILSAALDLVGPNVPKGIVLLADVIPSFFIKLCAPYFIHAVPYQARIMAFAALSAIGMLLIALTPSFTQGGTVLTKMTGVVLASLSSGGGELSFVGLTHFYGPFSLASWASGTGGAGLIGAGAYALATNSFGMSVRTTLLATAVLPMIMLMAFFGVLPGQALRDSNHPEARLADHVHDGTGDRNGPLYAEAEGLLAAEDSAKVSSTHREGHNVAAWQFFVRNLKRSRNLFIPL